MNLGSNFLNFWQSRFLNWEVWKTRLMENRTLVIWERRAAPSLSPGPVSFHDLYPSLSWNLEKAMRNHVVKLPNFKFCGRRERWVNM